MVARGVWESLVEVLTVATAGDCRGKRETFYGELIAFWRETLKFLRRLLLCLKRIGRQRIVDHLMTDRWQVRMR
jgi:hypothetical protein